jgi:LPS O-antigen subunit length determinant protein (WzzB/FepE family)
MEDMQPRYDDEIDLVDLFKTIWDGKWQIIGAVVVAAVAAVGVLRSLPNEFTATTEIRSVATAEADRYSESNALGFFKVDEERLQQTFIEELQYGDVLVQAVKRFGLIDRATFDSDAEYEEEVLEYADSIELLPPANQDGSERGAVRENWSLVGEYHDEAVWKNALRFIRETASGSARNTLRARFETAVREREIQDSFESEDLQQQIDNIILDYQRITSDRLAFLKEQAQLARTLGVAKNTIEAQTFGGQNAMVANLQMDTPFYLRGYEAIEKEIALIESREDIEAFAAGLFDLEKELRDIEQDLTLERARLLFDQTPVVTGEGFVAVSMVIEGTDFDVKRSKLMILVLVVLLTGMLAVIYVLISSAMRKRANQESVV